jgi:hypothetical protein
MHGKFWLTLFNVYALIFTFVFTYYIRTSSNETTVIWLSLAGFPIMIYLIAQFIVNYTNLTNINNENKRTN